LKDAETVFSQIDGSGSGTYFRPSSRTEVSIRADQFFLNSEPTFPGRTYKGMKVEGLLMATVRTTLPASAM